MEQNQVVGDAGSPESASFLNEDNFPLESIRILTGGDGGQNPSEPNPNFPLHLAARCGDLEKVKELLNGRDNESSVRNSLIRCLDDHGRTPLHWATEPASPHNLQVIRLLLQHDKEDSSTEGKPLLANLQDVSKRTALHYTAESEEPRMVSLLLEFGADPNLKTGGGGSTTLHILARSNSDSALECAKLLLDSGTLIPSADSETNKYGETAVHVATLNTAPKLLRLLVERGFEIFNPREHEKTPLMMASLAKDGDSDENLECVRILLGASSREQVNAKDSYENTAIHYAALHQRFRIVKLLASSSKTDLFTKGSKRKTVFHYAISGNSLSTVRFLCELQQMSREKFVEIIFHSHEPKTIDEKAYRYDSPIELALHCRHTKIVEYLLAAHPCEYKWMSDDALMSLIYSKLPVALLSAMNKSLRPNNGLGDDDGNLVMVDFGVITGKNDAVKQRTQETKYLAKIKDAPKREQKEILLHPLVQIFLERKWKRIRELAWIHIIIKLSWIGSYTLMVYEMYAPHCHSTDGANQTETDEGKGGRGGVEAEEDGMEHMRILHSLGFLQLAEDCRFNQTAVQCTALILYALSALVLVKECLQLIMKSYSYFRDWINYIQLGIVVVAVVNSAPAWQLTSASDLPPWQTNLAAVGMLVAWVMLLSELDNFPQCAVYSAILKTVLWNCMKMMLFYCPLFIGFAMCLRLLTPGKGQHKYLLFSLIKIVVMMTGEYDFEDAMYGNDDDDDTTSGPSTAYAAILGQIAFLLLVFVTTVVLLNLLTGLAVSDVRSLLDDRLSLQLKRMCRLESFILLARRKLVFVDSWRNLLYRWNVTGVRCYASGTSAMLVVTDLPVEFQVKIREIIGGVGKEESSYHQY